MNIFKRVLNSLQDSFTTFVKVLQLIAIRPVSWLGYVAIPMDFILGNIHWVYYSNYDTELYISDIAEFARVSLWIFVAVLWNKKSKIENVTVAWYFLNTLWDIFQTIGQRGNYTIANQDPTTEIAVCFGGILIIQFLFSKQFLYYVTRQKT